MNGRTRLHPTGREFAPPGIVSDRRGVVLVAVLWICALIMWFALQISAQTRLQGEDRMESIRKSQATHLAIGGCYEALARIGQSPPVNADAPPDLNWQPDGRPRIVEYRTGVAMVIISSDDRRVNINTTNLTQLKQVLEMAGTPEGQSEKLADTILDFIDQDDTPRMLGAEQNDYTRAGLNYGPLNGPLTSLDQLLLVPGITERLFYGYGTETPDMLPDVPEIYWKFLVPSKNSLFGLLTVHGKGTSLPTNFQQEEPDPRLLTWEAGGTYRILSFGMSRNGPPTAGIWLTVRFAHEGSNMYQILGRKIL